MKQQNKNRRYLEYCPKFFQGFGSQLQNLFGDRAIFQNLNTKDHNLIPIRVVACTCNLWSKNPGSLGLTAWQTRESVDSISTTLIFHSELSMASFFSSKLFISSSSLFSLPSILFIPSWSCIREIAPTTETHYQGWSHSWSKQSTKGCPRKYLKQH